MVEFDIEHILILVIVAFILYHLSSCRCSNNGFRVGGQSYVTRLLSDSQGEPLLSRTSVGEDKCQDSERMACLNENDCANKNLSNCDLQQHLFYEIDFSVLSIFFTKTD